MGLYNLIGNELTNFTIPEIYGAKGDGQTDDFNAIQTAVKSFRTVIFGAGKKYLIKSPVRLKEDTVLDLNGATIFSESSHCFYNFESSDVFTGYSGNGNIIIKNGTIIGGCTSFAHGNHILFYNVHFRNTIEAHFLEIAGCKNYTVRNCSFVGMPEQTPSVKEYINVDPVTYPAFPLLPNGSAFYDGTKNDGIYIDGCFFSPGENDYAYGFNAFGVHGGAGESTKHKDIRVTNNIIRGFTGCGLRINNMEDVIIANNEISVVGDGIRVGDVAQSIDVLIKSNVISASGTAVTKDNDSTIYQSADNDISPTFS